MVKTFGKNYMQLKKNDRGVLWENKMHKLNGTDTLPIQPPSLEDVS